MGPIGRICDSICKNEYVSMSLSDYLEDSVKKAGGTWQGLRYASLAPPTALVALVESITRLAIALITLVPVLAILVVKVCDLKSDLGDRICEFAGWNAFYSVTSGLFVWNLLGMACVLPFTKDSDFRV